ncbi:hypothetical protein, partial [Paracoccus marinaquae]
PRIRACLPTSSDLVPTFGRPDHDKRPGVTDRVGKHLKKDIRASSAPHLPALILRAQRCIPDVRPLNRAGNLLA